jgi:hypothetical protein
MAREQWIDCLPAIRRPDEDVSKMNNHIVRLDSPLPALDDTFSEVVRATAVRLDFIMI